MKASLGWLKAIAPDLTLDAQAVAERLAELGAPVEETTHLGAGLSGVRVARVVEARRHPNADRLSLCQVDAGTGAVHPVVCGAPNVRAGALYPFAPVGTTLPGDLTIRKAKIRGEVSEGMLCSARELGMGSDHTGILELPGELEVGAPLVEALGLDDWRLDVEVTANRGDLLSHYGLARELSPGGEAGLVLPPLPGAEAGGVAGRLEFCRAEIQARGAAPVRVEDGDLCHRYLGAVVRGVRIGPSPAWLQARLRAAGARPINNVVDATNYVMLELGQPLHAFDLARLEGGEVVVRRARASEAVFRTLDGVERPLGPDMLMICDASRPVAVAGVMGGEESEVTPETRDLLLECALFEPRSVRATRRALGLSTDASYRFERGVDPEAMERALARALDVILAVAGGTLEPRVADAHPRPWQARTLPLRLGRVEGVLGVPFSAAAVGELLRPLGFTPTSAAGGAQDTLEVRVPGCRSYDVTREIDLVEEVARRHGYDAFPATLGPYRPNSVPDHPLFRLEDELRRMLVERGLLEAQTPAFVPEGLGQVPLENPVSREEGFLRSAVLPSLLARVEHNFARGERNVRLFELGTAFSPGEAPDALPREAPHLALAFTGARSAPHWSGPAPDFDVWDVKGLLEDVAARLGGGLRAEPGSDADQRLVSETTVVLIAADGRRVGWGGRVSSTAIDAPPWAGPVWGIEIRLPDSPEARPPVLHAPLPSYPAVERDLALLVPEGVSSARVRALIEGSAGPELAQVELFDLYRGAGVPEGSRSLAFRLRFQSADRTLTVEEVDAQVGRVVARLAEELDVRVRG